MKDSRELLIWLAILIPTAVIITIFTGRKERARKKIEWEKLIAGKTKEEKNKLILGDLLVVIGIGGLIFSSIQNKVGGMSSGYIMIGSILSMIGGGFLRKRLKNMSIESQDSIDIIQKDNKKQ